MSQLFAPDGCVTPNIATQDYQVTFTASCEHTKLRGAEIVISAQSERDARDFAERWVRHGVLRQLSVFAVQAA